MNKLILLCLFLNSFYSVYAQTCSIQILDGLTKNSLSDVTIFNKSQNILTYSDINGFAIIKADNKDSILVSNLGYEDTLIIASDLNKTIVVTLRPIILEDIIIKASHTTNKQNINVTKLSQDEIERTSFIAGEPDIFQSLQILPGVSGTKEGQSDIVVRGGLPDQNLVSFDGVRMYNYGHFFGFVSLFNTDVIKDINLYKGNIPSEFGGKASSVIDVNLADNNSAKSYGNFDVGLISSRLFYNKSIVKNKLNVMGGFRSSYLDIVALPMKINYKREKRDDYPIVRLNDLTLKSTYRFNKNNRLSLTYLNTVDKFGGVSIIRDNNVESKKISGWKNSLLSLQYSSIFKKSTLGINLGYYNYTFFNKYSRYINNDTSHKFKNRIKEYSISGTLSTYHSEYLTTKFGVNIYRTDLQSINFVDYNKNLSLQFDFGKSKLEEVALFGQSNVSFRNWKSRLGLRGIMVYNKIHLFPRISLEHHWNNLIAGIAYDKNYQLLHRFTPVELGETISSWYQYPQNISISNQYSAYFKWKFNRLLLEGGIFAKTISKIPILENYYSDLSDLSTLTNDNFSLGAIDAKGVEFSVQYTSKKLLSRVSYTFLDSYTSWKSTSFATDFSRRHDFTFNVAYNLFKKIQVGATVVFKNGQPVTLPVNSYIDKGGYKRFIFNKKNNGRYPDYFRLDTNIQYKVSSRSKWNLNIYNVTNQLNPYQLSYKNVVVRDPKSSESYSYTKLKKESLFRILPTISYSRSF